jgi:hypothetical protein
MVWVDNIDVGEGIIPIHLLNPICAVHLRQEHGFKRWQTGRFREAFPWLIRGKTKPSPSRPFTTWCMSWCMLGREPSHWMRAAPSPSCD